MAATPKPFVGTPQGQPPSWKNRWASEGVHQGIMTFCPLFVGSARTAIVRLENA